MNTQDKYIGEIFDERYKLIKRVGEGGMSCVYEGFDSVENRMVAIKILKDEISNDSGAVKRFINESKAVKLMNHPNVVRIYDVSFKDDLKYIAMEYIDGITLKSYIKQKGVLSLAETISYTEQILRGLDHAHSKGVIHRDIKPQNILLLKDGHIKVTDFGIAKLPNSDTATMTDKAIGTVYYISPEQASGKPIDARSDLYSLGTVMYEMLTGELVFNADSPVQVAMKQVSDMPRLPHLINPNIPKGLEQIVMLALEKDPDMRFQSAKQMLSHLIQIKNNPDYVFKTKTKPMITKPVQATEPENKPTSKNKKSEKLKFTMFPVILGVMLAFITVFGISALIIVGNVSSSFIVTNDEDEVSVSVPDIVNQTLTEELRKGLSAQGFKVTIEYDDTATTGDANIILSTTPKAGTERNVVIGKKYADLKVVLSRGANSVILPDVTVHEYREAEIELEGLGLVCAEEYEYNDNVALGNVIRTSPLAGETVTSGGTVTLYISKGGEQKNEKIPQLVGLTEDSAKKTITDTGFVVGEITYENSSSIDEGIVISQSCKAGEIALTQQTVIDFVVSSGKD